MEAGRQVTLTAGMDVSQETRKDDNQTNCNAENSRQQAPREARTYRRRQDAHNHKAPTLKR